MIPWRGWGRQLFGWPEVEYLVGPVRGDIKKVSPRDAIRLCRLANSFSARGRPRWLQHHLDEVQQVLLIVFGPDRPGVLRCLAIAFTADDDAHAFTIDVSTHDFNSLANLSDSELVRLAHVLLYRFPTLPLEETGEPDPAPGLPG